MVKKKRNLILFISGFSVTVVILISLLFPVFNKNELRLVKESMSSKPFSTPTLGSSTWWNANWSYCMAITINKAQVMGALSNFPVCIEITSTNLKNYAQADADDIAFVSSNNATQYAHEIELWNSATGQLTAWVNVTSLVTTSNTIMYLYYGNPSASNQQNIIGTWDSNYLAVWHMSEASGTAYDSTSRNHDAVATVAPQTYRSTGQVGYAMDFEYTNNPRQYMTVGNSTDLDGLSALTIEAEYKQESNSNPGAILCKGGTTYSTENFILMIHLTGNLLFRMAHNTPSNAEETVYADGSMATATWYYIANTWSTGAKLSSYKNSYTLLGTSTNTFSGMLDTAQACIIANQTDVTGNPNRNFDGLLDEIRMSNVVRSAAWIRTTYNTITNSTNGSFFTLGGQRTNQNPWRNVAPIVKGNHPTNSTTNVALQSAVGCTVTDGNNNQTLTATFATNRTNPAVWVNKQTNSSLSNNSKINWTFSQANSASTKYWWRVYLNDGLTNRSFTFGYTTLVNTTIPRTPTQVFDSWFLCDNTTSRASTNILDYYFSCGNTTSRSATNMFDYYFLCGNNTIRSNTDIFDYYFICNNATIRNPTLIFDYYFICGNSSIRSNTNIFDYWFLCDNTSHRSNTNIFDYWFACGNNTVRISTQVIDYYFLCGNNTLRSNTETFDYYFLCGNNTLRTGDQILDYWFLCNNISSRAGNTIFDYYFICDNTSGRFNTDVFDYWFECRNETSFIYLTNPSPVGYYNLSINDSISKHSGDILFTIRHNHTHGFIQNTTIWFNNTLLFTNSSYNDTIIFWLFDYYDAPLISDHVYNWTVNCSSGSVYTNETYSFALLVESNAMVVIPITNFPMVIGIIAIIIIGIILVYFVFIREKKEDEIDNLKY